MKPGVALAILAMAAGSLVAPPPTASSAAAAQDGMNHAAVVVDTGDGTVRKMCLTFPEAEISGIEALQRVDTRPHRFETFGGGKGVGVCMLNGVGCGTGDCFCNASNYWAYHRAGPGESQYRTSSLGASNTVVRNGDVEAWKWGNGSAPMKTTVSEVCGVAEPPARTAATTTTATPATTTTASDGGSDPSPTSTTASPPTSPTSVPTAPPGASSPAPPGAPTTTTPPGAPDPAPPGEPAAPDETDLPEQETAPSAGAGAKDGQAAAPTEPGTSATGQFAGVAAFTALLGGLLVWRSRIRRAKVRRVRSAR